MRDTGLQQAIDAAGGIGALARALGIAQPSVSSWSRAPADRVLAIETLTGVSRSVLRPDLYPTTSEPVDRAPDLDEVAARRAQEYLLLAALLRRPPSQDLISRLTKIRGDGSALGLAHIGLAEAAGNTNETAVGREYFNLFIGVGRGELLPYASYYLTGFLNERPLARVREDFRKLAVERASGHHDPEDHIATLFEVMAGVVNGVFADSAVSEQEFFSRHIQPFAARFFADLAIAPSANFYRAVAAVGGTFIDIETEAFTIPNALDRAS